MKAAARFAVRRIAATPAFSQYHVVPITAAAEEAAPVVGAEDAFGLLASSAPFRAALMKELAAWPTPALYWECAPVDAASASAPFTFVLKDARPLHTAAADPSPMWLS